MFKLYKYSCATVVFLLLFSIPTWLRAEQVWENIEPGLDKASFSVASGVNIHIVALRFDASLFEFPLLTISSGNDAPQTLMQWAQSHDLVAAINASMYLPDGKTSTGYMRMGEHINNKRIAKKFGAFFLSRPRSQGLAQARVIDRDTADWEAMLEHYDIVIQNYRLINSKREVLWSAGGQKHSIAAVAEDGAGNILFLHCREPIMAHTFASALLDLPLDVRAVMYVEGGVQAGLVLRTTQEDILWGGRHPSDIFMGSVSVALPNVIGVLRKQSGINN